jgi:hypothetical protein
MKNYEAAALMQLVKARKIDHGVCGEISSHNNEEAFHIISFTDPSKNIPLKNLHRNQRTEAHKTSISTLISC